MYYLGYLSTASTVVDQNTVSGILEKSRYNNNRLGVTGILLLIDDCYLQIIEGEKDVLENLYSKISLDHRHIGVTRIIEGYESKRNFPDWSMGYKSLTFKESDHLKKVIDIKSEAWLEIENIFEDRHNPLLIFLKSFYIGNDAIS